MACDINGWYCFKMLETRSDSFFYIKLCCMYHFRVVPVIVIIIVVIRNFSLYIVDYWIFIKFINKFIITVFWLFILPKTDET